jgi:hypothetical protein
MTCFLDMTGFCNSWRDPAGKQTWLQPACLALAGLALMAAVDPAGARARKERAVTAESVAPRPAGAPVMAIVSLRSQGVTVYDASGWIMRAPVSSGQTGRETPAGVFSVIEKDPDHHSNLYDDAWMPHMHRITWSGIALHGGPLPGYPASHGCIRLPYDFATRLFDISKVGLRVIVAPGDVAPAEIAHPVLFPSKPGVAAAAATLATQAAEAARSKADQARRDAASASREAALAMAPVRAVETLKRKAAARLAAAERTAAVAHEDEAKQLEAEEARANAEAEVAEADVKLNAAKAGQQSKLDAATAARKAIAEAEARRTETAEAARKAARDLEPASVFISRKTQRLYVRQAFQPVLESPVTIQDPDRAIGTHVFTAVGRVDGAANLRWNVVSLDHGHPDGRVAERRGPARDGGRLDVEPAPATPEGAKAALDRIAIPQDVADRIAGMMSPRSSMIVSDEALSPETGKGTEFVVVMNDEPQGGIAFRRHGSSVAARRERMDGQPLWRNSSPFGFPW